MKKQLFICLLSLVFMTSCFFSSNADFGRLFLQIAAIVNISPSELLIGTDSYGIRSYQFSATGGTAPYTYYYSNSIGSTVDTNGLFYPGSSPETIFITARDFAGARSTARVSVLDHQKIVPNGESGPNDWLNSDYFGRAVALTDNWLVIGAPSQDYDSTGTTPYTDAGAVYVYKRVNTSWVFSQKITASDRAPGIYEFGKSVSIDGNLMAVGSPEFAGGMGKVYIYNYNGTSWVEELQVPYNSSLFSNILLGTLAKLGHRVVVKGSYVAMSAPYITGTDKGYVYVLKKSDAGVWSQHGQRFTGSDSSFGDDYGYSMDFDGEFLVVGAYDHVVVHPGEGAVYVNKYDEVTALWQEVAKLISASPIVSLRFGSSVGVSNNMIAVGVSGYFGSGANEGIVHVFDKGATDALWTKKSSSVLPYSNYLSPTGTGGDTFGDYLSFRGGNLAVSSPLHAYDESEANMVANAGSIHVYNCIHGESSCSFRNKITATGTNSRQVNDQFGISVSITEKGWVAGGAHWHSYDLSGGASGFNQGAVWVAY